MASAAISRKNFGPIAAGVSTLRNRAGVAWWFAKWCTTPLGANSLSPAQKVTVPPGAKVPVAHPEARWAAELGGAKIAGLVATLRAIDALPRHARRSRSIR